MAAKCNKCGASIAFLVTGSGRKMPVNTEEIPFVPDDLANYIAAGPDGIFIRGRPCSESYEDERWIYARISHFATCPSADEFRRK